MLMLILMLMLCLGKSGCDRRHIVEAALSMRDVTSREEEPSFVIRDPIYVKESTKCTLLLLHVFNVRWFVRLGLTAKSFVFGQLIRIPQGWLLPVIIIIIASWSTTQAED